MGGGGSKETQQPEYDIKVSGHLIDQIAHEQLGLQISPKKRDTLRHQREHRIWVSDLTEQERREEVARLHRREKEQLHVHALELTQKIDELTDELEGLRRAAESDKESQRRLQSRLIEIEQLQEQRHAQEELQRQFEARISSKVIESQAPGFVPPERPQACGAEREALAECMKGGRDIIECAELVRGLNACAQAVQKDFVLHSTQLKAKIESQ